MEKIENKKKISKGGFKPDGWRAIVNTFFGALIGWNTGLSSYLARKDAVLSDLPKAISDYGLENEFAKNLNTESTNALTQFFNDMDYLPTAIFEPGKLRLDEFGSNAVLTGNIDNYNLYLDTVKDVTGNALEQTLPNVMDVVQTHAIANGVVAGLITMGVLYGAPVAYNKFKQYKSKKDCDKILKNIQNKKEMEKE